MEMCTIRKRNIRKFLLTKEQHNTRRYRPGDIIMQRRRLGPKGVVQ